ncbi:hypothetical protein MAPG_08701 [Magnaporthiopsis poae ATCC 64411]|uniref:Velvet domain-containing protein n=1 Tax=Magnaporthiopsis poae (strain ATCC 64411 / 73-15) TaxID=644358 RepID=A0A0C4E815_MAGP6|nr:hypothetical protein MAPG_08701 [Magnaporthiopsis poae ATCC 64411]
MEPDTMPQSSGVMIERTTKGGRRLFYHLEVIQQPERARACGSGPKSTSDRRPVDPPPVVELRIFEGPRRDQARDITFTYNANFFLFATLENARVIAHARGQPPPPSTTPVLTGMPVSGMAYLDRPQEAGYFLFPDLSVRHEGRYKLAFNLYEETKDDADKDPDNGEPQGASFDWRMELKSADFTVYSAKKPSDADFRPPPPGFQSQVPPPPPPPSNHVGYNGAPQYGAPPRPHYAPPPPPSSSGHASPAPPQSPSYSQHQHPAYGQPQPPTPVSHTDRRPSLHPVDAQQRLYNPSPRRDSFVSDGRRMSTVTNYCDRSSTPLSAHEYVKADDHRSTVSTSLKLPGISTLVTQDAMQAPPPPPPPPPHTQVDAYKQPPMILPGPPDDHVCLDPNSPRYLWADKPLNANGKRQRPDDVSTNWLYRANSSAKNGQRPETRPLPLHFTNVDGFLRPLGDEHYSNPDKPWLQYRTR